MTSAPVHRLGGTSDTHLPKLTEHMWWRNFSAEHQRQPKSRLRTRMLKEFDTRLKIIKIYNLVWNLSKNAFEDKNQTLQSLCRPSQNEFGKRVPVRLRHATARQVRLHPLSCDFSATSLISVFAKLRATSRRAPLPRKWGAQPPSAVGFDALVEHFPQCFQRGRWKLHARRVRSP